MRSVIASLLPNLFDFAAVAVVFFVAALLQGAVGFGFGMLPMALLPFFVSIRYASVLVAFLAVFNAAYLSWSLRRSIPWRVLLRLLIGSAVGLPLGIYVLKEAPESAIQRIVGVSVIVYAAYNGWSRRRGGREPRRIPLWWSYPTGAVAAALGGAANVAGPPLIFYLYGQRVGRDAFRAALASYFLVVSLGKSVMSVAAGLAYSNMAAYVAVLPLIWLGAKLGLDLGTRLNRAMFANVVLIALAALGIALLM